MNSNFRIIALACGIVLLLVLAACGADESFDDAQDRSATQPSGEQPIATAAPAVAPASGGRTGAATQPADGPRSGVVRKSVQPDRTAETPVPQATSAPATPLTQPTQDPKPEEQPLDLTPSSGTVSDPTLAPQPTPSSQPQSAPPTATPLAMPAPTTMPAPAVLRGGGGGGGGGAGAMGRSGAQGEVVQELAVMEEPPPQGPEGFNTIGGSATVNDADYDLTFFKHYGVNPFIDTEDDHLSTFAMDVDTASYTVARRFVQDGYIPDPDSIRVEEFVNFFDQEYEPPVEEAFAIHLEGSPSRFGGDNHWLWWVGLQGKSVSSEERKDATLIFTIDVSGSMGREDRLELVKRSLRLLVDELRPTDEVGIVIYGSRGSALLEPTSGRNKEAIMEAIDALHPGGATFVEDGLRLAYRMAESRVKPGRITRVLLLSDGVGNVGNTGADSILKQIRSHVEEGVTLTTVGFGMGNYNDILMEQLANDGDGTYHYVDSLAEARRIFVEGLTGTLQVIAKDAKVQVDFNPEVVSRFRLLGYENRRVADEDFRDDTIDAGEIGADHSVTAVYELKLHDSAEEGNLATVYLRYEDPENGEVVELSRDFSKDALAAGFEQASFSFQMAAVVAEYAEILRESYWAQDGSLGQVVAEARRIQRLLPETVEVAEFADLVFRADRIWSRENE